MQVYLSHADADQDLASAIGKVLTEEGLRVWDAGIEVFPGDNYAEVIAKGLKGSSAMVVLFTPKAIETSLVLKDVDFAIGCQRFAHRLIPVLARDPDDRLLDQIPWILKRFPLVHLADKENPRRKIQKVARDLKQGKGKPRAQKGWNGKP